MGREGLDIAHSNKMNNPSSNRPITPNISAINNALDPTNTENPPDSESEREEEGCDESEESSESEDEFGFLPPSAPFHQRMDNPPITQVWEAKERLRTAGEEKDKGNKRVGDREWEAAIKQYDEVCGPLVFRPLVFS